MSDEKAKWQADGSHITFTTERCSNRWRDLVQMKKFALATFLLCTTSVIGFAAGIDGKWTSERQVGDRTITSTYNLKSEGSTLTGTIETSFGGQSRSVDIQNGKIDGDKFSFKAVQRGKQGETTVVYEGTVEGDQLKGTMKPEGGDQSRPFMAKKAD